MEAIIHDNSLNEANCSIGFECKVCNESQPVYNYREITLPICDRCLSDLKEIILAKRNAK